MIVDTSAVLAIFLFEPERDLFESMLGRDLGPTMSAATLVELAVVSGRQIGPAVWPEMDAYLRRGRVEIVPFTAEHAALAREGWRRYGKGRHPAALNLGDCFSYALAKSRNEPLLFKGDDFAQTDVRPAI